MARITGTAGDCNLAAVESFGLELIFTLSAPAVSGSSLRITRPIVVPVLDDGSWLVTIPDTETMQQARYYTMQAQWLDPVQGMGRVDFPDFELRVPVGGGAFSELVSGSMNNPLMVFWQTEEPDPWPVGAVFINTNSGDIYRKDS